MKKLIAVFFAAAVSLYAAAHDSTNVDPKMLGIFNASFPNAQEVTWHELPEAYIANFIENGIRSKIVYSKDGQATQLTRTYQAQNLPYAVSLKIREEFPGKKIFGVVEILTNSERENLSIVEYYIKLEDAKNWITVKVNGDGETSIIEKYRKAS